MYREQFPHLVVFEHKNIHEAMLHKVECTRWIRDALDAESEHYVGYRHTWGSWSTSKSEAGTSIFYFAAESDATMFTLRWK